MNIPSLFKESRFIQWLIKVQPEKSLFDTSVLLKPFSSLFPASSAEIRTKITLAGKWILALMLIACVFVPRLSLKIGGTFRLDLRMEDSLLLVLIFLAFWQRAFETADSPKEIPGVPTGFGFVEKSFLFFFLAAGISILSGIWIRTLEKPLLSLFYFLKWAEYFLVFVMAARFSRGRQNSLFLMKFFFILGLAIACYGYWETAFPADQVVYPNYYRLYERFPFYGDSNHVCGLLVLWIAFFCGIYLKSQKPLETGILATGLLLVFPTFLLTYSRKSYFALAMALLPAFLIKGSRRRLLLLILGYALIAILLPSCVIERMTNIGEALASTEIQRSSWAADIDVWDRALWNFDHFWLFGAGFGARHRIFYESQYVMILTETGFAGFAAFLALVFSPLREVAAFWPQTGKRAEGIAWGWILGLTGMLVHNISCISWTIVKIAVPYWFLTGVVLSYLAAEKNPAPAGTELFLK